ncbi:hypothetical protein DFH09DRAFT_1045624 [Mycena vulgaris]|nr:hypothetical protein DFH09DRAFT_1045624 [Mycena vulgaris]
MKASRLASLIYTLGNTLFASYPLARCNTAFIVFNSFYPIAVSATALLFFFRVRAIYGGSHFVTVIFGFLSLAGVATSVTVATSVAVPISARATSFGNPPQCVLLARHHPYSGSSGITLTIHATVVFFAISYRLVSNFTHAQQTRRDKVTELFSGANLPAFSKALFDEGQMYYMATVVSNIFTTVMVYVPNANPLYHGLLIIPNVTLTSIMACRVYRHTKLGFTRTGEELVLPTLNPRASEHQSIQLSAVDLSPERTAMTRSAGDDSYSTGGLSGAMKFTLKVNDLGVSSEVQHDTGVVILT